MISKSDLDEPIHRLTKLTKQTHDKTTRLLKITQKEDTIPREILELTKFKNRIKNT